MVPAMDEQREHGEGRSPWAQGWRYAVAGVGVVFVGIGAVGAVVPGLPTTVFLIIASACFAKSCPWLEDRLLKNRLFQPYMRYVGGERAMTRREKATTLAIMWTFVTVSVLLLLGGGASNLWIVFTVVMAAAVGSVFVVHWKGRRATAEQADGEAAGCPAAGTREQD